jgi:hypothetical protein
MPELFFKRLRDYWCEVAKVLKGEAKPASIFPNTTDIGMCREWVYAKFLETHVPSKCNVRLGGFLFDAKGNESKQIDIIVSTDTVPKFNFYNRDGGGKCFSHLEGTIGVVSVKSNLNKKELFNALENIASIPAMAPLTNRVNPLYNVSDYDDWPFKVVYASDGLNARTIKAHLETFLSAHKDLPRTRQPNLIHVAGKYTFIRMIRAVDLARSGAELGHYRIIERDSDVQAIAWTIGMLTKYAESATQISFTYPELINRVLEHAAPYAPPRRFRGRRKTQ